MSKTPEKEVTELKHEAFPGYTAAFYIVVAVCCVAFGLLLLTHMP